MPSNTPTSTLALIAIQPLDKINTSHDGNGAAAAGRAGLAAHSGRLAVLQCLGVDHGALQKAAGACRQLRGRSVAPRSTGRSAPLLPAAIHRARAARAAHFPSARLGAGCARAGGRGAVRHDSAHAGLLPGVGRAAQVSGWRHGSAISMLHCPPPCRCRCAVGCCAECSPPRLPRPSVNCAGCVHSRWQH